MATNTQTVAIPAWMRDVTLLSIIAFVRRVVFRSWPMTAGVTIILAFMIGGWVGPMILGSDKIELGAGDFSSDVSDEHWLGTDAFGRDIFVFSFHALLPTLTIGVIAGGVATGAGVFLGLVSGYKRGPIDTVIRTMSDIAMTIPSLAVLIVIAAYVRTTSIEMMALVVAIFAWPWATRVIRAQTLTLREKAFVTVSKLSGEGELEIAFKQIFPNLLPYVMSAFAGTVNTGILAAVGLQILGLGPVDTPSLGLMLDESFRAGAMIRGFWWWWLPPTVLLAFLFIGVFLLTVGLDEIANPRLQASKGQAAVE